VDYSANTTTGSHLLTYEKAVDIGIFDGRLMTVARRTRPIALPPPEEAPNPRAIMPLTLMGIALAFVGVIAVGYAAFQLYGTNILTARTQDSLEAQFAARQAAGPGEYVPGATTAGTIADPSAFDDPSDVPVIIGPVQPVRPFPPEEAALYSWLYEGLPTLEFRWPGSSSRRSEWTGSWWRVSAYPSCARGRGTCRIPPCPASSATP
jgi:hypothetical protein